jgi:hypothetical protein
MSLRPIRNILAIALLAAAVCAVEADAQQPPKAPANAAQTAKTTPQAAPQQPAAAGGVMVFIDPATGKIRQPDAAEIGTLSGTSAPANASGGIAPAIARRPLARPVEFRGPGNSVGLKLGEDSLSYMVVTKTPDGKLVEDCVTGDQAAAAMVSKGVTPKPAAAPKKAKEVLDDK